MDVQPDSPSTPEPAVVNWKLCFICGSNNKTPTHKVQGSTVKESLMQMLAYRTDPESEKILATIRNDLVQVEARYHAKCLVKYKRNDYANVQPHSGRKKEPVDRAMQFIYDYIDENYDRCQFRVSDLRALIPDEPRPCNETILQRIREKYGEDNIVVHGSKATNGTIVCFKTTSEKLLLEAWKKQELKSNADDIKNTRKVAAKIRESIRTTVYKQIDEYPPSTSFMDGAEEDVHELLMVFLNELILPGKKGFWNTIITTIGHIIMKATRPRCFSSRVLLGLGCFLKKKFGSRDIIDCLHSIGLSCSYSEIQLLENCYISMDQPDILPNGFFQWAADNADFNINTLDGHNSWHVMALIQCVTPSNAIEEAKAVARNIHKRRSIDAAELGKIELIPYEDETYAGLSKIQIVDLNELYPISTPTLPDFKDLLFAYGKWKCNPSIPSWNGFMEQVTEACPFETSKVLFHPFINAKPTDKTTVNTTLSYVYDAAVKSGRKTPIVNFDQQLYWIARDIVANYDRYKDIFVRLGGFHLLMSFMGAIGKIMSGSGLEELWSTIYAEGSIPQMLIGKAYARAVRAHLLTNLSLAKIILDSMDEEEDTFDGTRDFLEGLLNNFDRTHVMDALTEESSFRFSKLFERKLAEFESRGPTAKLWVQYYRMTCLLKQFLEAERSGNWSLYVSTIRRMVPFFYSTGHNNYAKSTHLYLQDIATLEERMTPQEFQIFTEKGFFTIRRSNKFFCGISPDQTIEQTTMRLAKTRGGLTLPGRGITESETAKWTMSMYSLMNICEQFETFAGVYSQTSEQHVDLRPARVERDNKDVHTLDCWFAMHNPFPRITEIVSIGTGVVGDAIIDCHLAEEKGIELMSNATNYTFKSLSFKREKQVKPLSFMIEQVKVNDKVVAIDPMLIFQRIAICGRTTDGIGRFFDHELAPYPMSLFDEGGMRKGTKSSLYEAFAAITPNIPKESRFYVVDGGYLLHKVKWKKDTTIQEVCTSYVKYLKKHYSDGKTAVIFDGYPSDSDIGGTKSAERIRRSAKHNSPSIDFDYTTSITVSQDYFLSNDENKNSLIQLLRQQFAVAGFETDQAFEDADHLIVTTALLQSSHYTSVTIVGEDIDLLVLLVALGGENDNVYFRKPSNGKNSGEKIYSSQSFKYASLRKYVLVLHAFTGCDTTSAPYSQGKVKLVKALSKIIEDADQDDEKRDNVVAALNIFYEKFTSTELVHNAGLTIFTVMYNGTSNDLARTRFKKFSQCATKTKVNLCSLPPSPDAANFHSRRVYLQVQAWLGRYLDPTTWGWKRSKRGLEPIMTVKPPAPSAVMDLISCSCKTNSTSNEQVCGSRCGCRKAGVPCSVACTNCSGEDCSNVPLIEIEEETFLDDDDLDFPSQIVHFSTASCSTEIRNKQTQKSNRQSSGSSSSEGARSESPEQTPQPKRLRSADKQ